MPIGEFLMGALSGAIGGVAADHIRGPLEQLLPHEVTAWEDMLDHLPETIKQAAKDLRTLAESDRGTFLRPVNLFGYPSEWIIEDHHRSHLSIFVITSTAIRLNIMGIGVYSPTLVAGWNILDIPCNGSAIALPGGVSGPVPVLFMWSDQAIGDAI